STIATVPDGYEGCCARRATWVSASFRMTHLGSNEPLSTCGARCEQWIVWCELNDEQDLIEEAFGSECVSIYGTLESSEKERRYRMWATGSVRILVTKPAMFGFGINMQFASH